MRSRKLGARWIRRNDGHLPTTVMGTRRLRGPVRVPSDISSQYLTSLLIIAPLHRRADSRSRWKASSRASRTSISRSTRWRSSASPSTTRTTRHCGSAPQAIARAPSTSKATRRRRRISRRWPRCTAGASRSAISARGTRQGDYAFFGLCETARRDASTRTAASTVIEGPRALTGGFDGAGRHDQHAGRRADVDDDRAIPVDSRRASPDSPRCA